MTNLNDEDLEWIRKIAQSKTLLKDEILIESGQKLEYIYWVVEGCLNRLICQVQTTGEIVEKVIATIEPGELIGDIGFLDVPVSSVTIKSQENSLLLSLSWSNLTEKFKQDLGFAARFYQTLATVFSQRLRKLSAFLVRNQIVASPPLRKVLLMFAIFRDSDLDWMINIGQKINALPDNILIQQGKEVNGIYLLLEGLLTVTIAVEEQGKEVSQEVAQLPSGEMIGEMSFVETGLASATVKTKNQSLLLGVSKSLLMAKLQQDFGFAGRFYQAIAIVLSDRLQDRLMRRGYGQIAYIQGQSLQENMEYEDELDLDVLEQTALAGTRFDWLVRRVRTINN